MENNIKPKILFLLSFDSIKSRIFFNYLSEAYKDLKKKYQMGILLSDEDFKNLDLDACPLMPNAFYTYKSKNLSHYDDILLLNNFEILVTNGWGHKISNKAIQMVKLCALNCHSSYLPDYKGASVYYAQWANLEKEGGVTCHIMTENFDEGNIIYRQKFKINFLDTPKKILQKASNLSGPIIFKSIDLVLNNYQGISQKGGRYFMQANKAQLLFYRIWNIFFSKINFLRLVLPHKTNEK